MNKEILESPNRLMRIAEVCELTSIAKSTLNLWVTQGKFPAPAHLSSTVKVWKKSDIDNWIESLGKNHV
jgi:prophage regulatory protein